MEPKPSRRQLTKAAQIPLCAPPTTTTTTTTTTTPPLPDGAEQARSWRSFLVPGKGVLNINMPVYVAFVGHWSPGTIHSYAYATKGTSGGVVVLLDNGGTIECSSAPQLAFKKAADRRAE